MKHLLVHPAIRQQLAMPEANAVVMAALAAVAAARIRRDKQQQEQGQEPPKQRAVWATSQNPRFSDAAKIEAVQRKERYKNKQEMPKALSKRQARNGAKEFRRNLKQLEASRSSDTIIMDDISAP